MADLLLTLGHNASAVAVHVGNDGTATIENAYELERLSGVKSDSRFPLDAMLAIRERGIERFDRVFVTHWDPMNRLEGMKTKYWDPSVFPADRPIFTQERYALSHHDCHAHAAMAFAGEDFPQNDTGLLVIDGFGNFCEHISYYKVHEHKPILVRRFHGYHTSLGLMYQYATAYLGMKMHEDEYKLLGYGAKIEELGVDRKTLVETVLSETKLLVKAMRRVQTNQLNPALEVLPLVQAAWAKRFDHVISAVGMQGTERSSYEARVLIGYVVQMVLEMTVQNLFMADIPKPRNLIMTGGVAFNVALNRMLLNFVPGKLCVMPLAGDQGNTLGLWAHANPRATLDFGDLCWGKRNMSTHGITELPDGLDMYQTDGPKVAEAIASALKEVGFVNLVRGRMEYGPRALCNTTTLARADDAGIVAEINRINGRDTVMPFAPVVWHERMATVFPDSSRLWKSDRFMICALDYDREIGPRVPGAALVTSTGVLTGRPQAYFPKYEGDSVAEVVRAYGLLINTSFNVHGVPICCDLKDVIHSHQFQRERNPNVRTLVIAS